MKEKFYDLVKTALQAEGWTITHDPYFLSAGGTELYIDLGAEKLIAAVKQNQKIAVEVKSFTGKSQITEFYSALGQYLTYQQGLKIAEPDRLLYLAIPKTAKDEVFSLILTQQLVAELKIKLLVYSLSGEIISWEQKN
ncbi:MAG: element excision factor XisH family protein [Pleurocapsa sp. MO_226.B13]|nr:element excision factor XisH family protein [Pleurocapsa sp. MO_226.B13]